MFGTVLHDVFEYSDVLGMRNALDELCAPDDAYGWASVGVYCFFDPTRSDDMLPGANILYIGLATDVSERFAQHVGLVSFPASGSKNRKIESWFAENSNLGFSCFVQSPFAQVDTHRERAALSREANRSTANLESHPEYGHNSAVQLEGQLIGAYRLVHRRLPPWNEVGGSLVGDKQAQGAIGLLDLLTGVSDSLFRARMPLRGLAEDPTASAFEETLHFGRMMALVTSKMMRCAPNNLDVLQALYDYSLDDQGDPVSKQRERLKKSGYLRKGPGVPGDWWGES